MLVHEATNEELANWDDLTVCSPNGSVLQSRAWAAYRAAFGWRPRFLVTGDGGRVLALARPWPLVGGEGVYISRGPLPDADPHLTLARLEAVTAWLAERRVAVVSSDSEMPAASGYPGLLATAGFHPIEEIQPSRHKLALDLTGSRDAIDLLAGFSATTRNMIRAAERSDLSLVQLGPPPPAATDSAGAGNGSVDVLLGELDSLYVHMRATADRRGFGLASKARFTDWTRRAFEAGELAYIGTHAPGGELVAGATFYRHGQRWTYANAADDPRFRKAYPGAVRRVVWEAMKVAVGEGRTEFDLGGVDVHGARRRPDQVEPAYGMLAFKESFGARWIELSGAHERVLSPVRYGLGRVSARLATLTGRG